MNQEYIESKMHELEKIICYKFKDINYLCDAMKAIKNKDSDDYTNDRLVIVGDALLDFIIIDMLYKQHKDYTKEMITDEKKSLVNNTVQHHFLTKDNLIDKEKNII